MYEIRCKLGNRSTEINNTIPADAELIWRRMVMLRHDENITIPLVLTFNETAINLRLLCELWALNESSKRMEYWGRWVQLWLNVTG